MENCQTISATVSESVGSGYSKMLIESSVKTVSKAIDSRVFITDNDGNVIVCSCQEWNTVGSCVHSQGEIDERIIKRAKDGEYYEVGKLSSKYSEAHYTYACPIVSDNGVIGIVFASSPASAMMMLIGNVAKMFLISAIIPVVLLFVSIYAITYRFTRPLRYMSIAAKKMSMGDFSMRVPVSGNDEIAELAKSFNNMTDALVKMEGARRSFVANVSHELRTPMTTIGGFIDGIIDGTIEQNKSEYYLKIVSNEVKRLTRLVQSMLSLAKLESGEQQIKLAPVDLYNTVCESVISQEQRIEAKNIEITGLESLEPVVINADGDLIHQVVYNLIDNAIKFVNQDGYINFQIKREQNSVVFKIRNSGVGIKPEELKYVFDRFYKADKSRSSNKNSTGLGLYIVKTIVDIHKGKILVRSLYGEYTEFEMTLPIENQLKSQN